jgi:SAM-dependent methyltransferase
MQEYLSSLYENASEFVISKGFPEKLETPEELTRISQAIMDSLNREEGFNYLEIGVGSGQLFSIFKEKAELCYGVEPGNWHMMDKNIVKDIDNLPENIHFDVIVAYDVLEHLCSPTDMMRKLRKVANHGAVIHCSFPNRDSLPAAIWRGDWEMVRPVGHLHYFSSRSIERMFEKSRWGLLEKMSCRPRNLSFGDLMMSLGQRARDRPLNTTWHLLINQLLLGKDQWVVKGMALDSK